MAYGQEQVILITGAASGLGWALTQQYLALGHFVVMADIQKALLQERVADINEHRVTSVCMDITQEADVRQLIIAVEEKYGRLDTLINNAGITHRSLIEKTHPKVFRRVMDVDYHGPVALSLAALPLLKQSKGLIINISSMAGWMPVLGRGGYCAAKSALHQFFEVMRCEVKQYDVNIMMVYPSFLDTPIEMNALGANGERASHKRSLVGKMSSAQDVAKIIINGHKRNKLRIFPDGFTWLASIVYKLMPNVFLKSMSRQFASELQ